MYINNHLKKNKERNLIKAKKLRAGGKGRKRKTKKEKKKKRKSERYRNIYNKMVEKRAQLRVKS